MGDYYANPTPIRGKRRFENSGGLNTEIYAVENMPGWLEKKLKIPEPISAKEETESYVKPGIDFLNTHLKPYLPEHHLEFKLNQQSGKYEPSLYTLEVYPMDLETDIHLKEKYLADLLSFLLACCQAFEATYNSKNNNGEVPELMFRSLIFGKTVKNDQPQLFLVDLYPTILCKSDRFQELMNQLITQVVSEIGEKARDYLEPAILGASKISQKYHF